MPLSLCYFIFFRIMADLTPVFRRSAAGRLILQDSLAAIRFKNQPKKDHRPPKKGEVVKNEATEAVKRAGGEVKSQIQRLGQYRVQFGAYR